MSTLLDPPQPPTRNGSPDTSFEAADSIDVSRMQQLVLAAMHRMRTYRSEPAEAWLIQGEVEAHLQHSVSGSTIRTRLSELTDLGFVTLTDRTGLSKTGHRCARYALAEIGKAA
ncbi:hypothetical protein BPY_07210 [Bifidobacterium psychraerophilum]|uniref:hypothetical protein n=1 Tax=Bifidobacterium psychraerophilum TaxID=218140 RepID=UPI003118D5FB